MDSTSLQIDPLFFVLILLTLFIFWISRKFIASNTSPFIYFSSLSDLMTKQKLGKAKWTLLPFWLYLSAFGLIAIALMDPHIQYLSPLKQSDKSLPNKGVAIYLVLDRSGSMNEKTSRFSYSKMELMKQVSEDFVKTRPNDLIGLVTFARAPQVKVPLTTDHDLIIKEIQGITTVKRIEDEGTALGYAIHKTSHLIDATKRYTKKEGGYDLKGSIIILVTDGFQESNPLDVGDRLRTMEIDEAASFAKESGIKLYIVNIDPKISAETFAPHRRLLKQYAEETGGRFYYVRGDGELEEIYKEIDKLEKGDWNLGRAKFISFKRFSFYPYLILISLLSLLAGWFAETTWLRRVP